MNVAVGAVATVALGAVAVGAAALVLHSAPTKPPLLVATSGTATATLPAGVKAVAGLELDAYADSSQITWRRTDGGVGPHPDWVSYGPTTELQVPAHALVTVTIRQYDSGEPIPNPYLAEVHGTVGGTMTVDGAPVTQDRRGSRRPHVHDPQLPELEPGPAVRQRPAAGAARRRRDCG